MNEPIRVLHIVVNMNRGGAETFIMNLYRNIDRTKVQFDFLVQKMEKGAYEDEIEELGGRVYRIHYITKSGHFAYIKQLNAFFKANKQYSIVHCHMDCMSGLVLRAAKKNGIGIRIAHSHNTQNSGNLIIKAYKTFSKFEIAKNANKYLACSKEAGNWLFGKEKEFEVINNGIDLEKFKLNCEIRNKLRKKLGIKNDTYVLGHIGRFDKVKNHKFLIEVFYKYNKTNENSNLILIGEGRLKEEIKSKVKDLGLSEKVKFLGSRSDVNLLLNCLDLIVFPSLFEGLPVTLIEAQVNGVNCLISDTISKDVDLSLELIKFKNINEEIDNWVKEISDYKNVKRKDVSLNDSFLDRYNIKNIAKNICEKYVNMNEEV